MLSAENEALIARTFGPLIQDPKLPKDGMCHVTERALNALLDAARAEGVAAYLQERQEAVRRNLVRDDGSPAFPRRGDPVEPPFGCKPRDPADGPPVPSGPPTHRMMG